MESPGEQTGLAWCSEAPVASSSAAPESWGSPSTADGSPPPAAPQTHQAPSLGWVDAPSVAPSEAKTGNGLLPARRDSGAAAGSKPGAVPLSSTLTRAPSDTDPTATAAAWLKHQRYLKQKEAACVQDLAISVAANGVLQQSGAGDTGDDAKRAASDQARLRDKLLKKRTAVKDKVRSHIHVHHTSIYKSNNMPRIAVAVIPFREELALDITALLWWQSPSSDWPPVSQHMPCGWSIDAIPATGRIAFGPAL